MEDIRIAVVGLGSRGTMSWIPMLHKLKGYRVVSVCDPIQALHEGALARCERPEEVKAYTNYEDVLADPNIDAVALTVRCEEQGELAAQALEAGKHVNSEVPAAHRLEDCWRIVVAQERSGKVYQLAEQCRFAGYVQEWRKLVADGRLGDITYCEGQYFHYYIGKSFQDPDTGEFVDSHAVSERPAAEPTWVYHMAPIHYLPHDLSPVLRVTDDRVTQVVGMSTDSPSKAHPELVMPDMQAAMMKTEKGAIMRMAASFAQPHPHHDCHWQQIIGTKGAVEWRRSGGDKPKVWFDDSEGDKVEVDWGFQRPDAPEEARGSGHNDMDYYVHASFRDAVISDRPLEFDVYKAMDTAAPAILAAESIAGGSQPLAVPDFRPGKARQKGQMPDNTEEQ
ncbi:MAG: Gfo/Idh/MocA family oxidoreductase [Planctomycetota bacterium]|jgi:predicted dehydrogenase|nr:Gfo/Idh/MocA family oxidoreductase [Planctomycetota bacterium]MDP7251388.1 Gfo/Idh/MocA family oxidoreductase [Planctomycetota bacterium]